MFLFLLFLLHRYFLLGIVIEKCTLQPALSQKSSIFQDTVYCITRNVAGKTRYYAEYFVKVQYMRPVQYRKFPFELCKVQYMRPVLYRKCPCELCKVQYMRSVLYRKCPCELCKAQYMRPVLCRKCPCKLRKIQYMRSVLSR